MKMLFIFLNLVFMLNQYTDVEKIIGYNPRRIVVVPKAANEYNELKQAIISTGFRRASPHSLWYVKYESDFIWVFRASGEMTPELLFKYFGHPDDLEEIQPGEPILRKVVYRFYNINNQIKRVTHITGYDEISAILNYFSEGSKVIHHNNEQFIQLAPGMLLRRESIIFAQIYPDLETYDHEQKTSMLSSLALPDKTVSDYEKNIGKLGKTLDLKIDVSRKITREVLDAIASTSFDYAKKGDLFELSPEYCSLMAKYLIDNYDGELKFIDGTLYFVTQSEKFDIQLFVSSTLDHLMNYEYNPNLYFMEYPED